MSRPLPPGGLAAALLAASDWFNDALLVELRELGWPPVNRTQSLVFLKLGAGEMRPAELARRIGISRQSMQTLLDGLDEAGLVAQRADPDDRRAKLASLTGDGRRFVGDAQRLLRGLERSLARRIGQAEVEALRRVLSLDWGEPP